MFFIISLYVCYVSFCVLFFLVLSLSGFLLDCVNGPVTVCLLMAVHCLQICLFIKLAKIG